MSNPTTTHDPLLATLNLAVVELHRAAAASELIAHTRAGYRVGKWDLDGDDNAIWEHGSSQDLCHAALALGQLASGELDRATAALARWRRGADDTEEDATKLRAELEGDDDC